MGREVARRARSTVHAGLRVMVIGGLLGMLALLFTVGPAPATALAASGDWSKYLFDNASSGYNGAETTINQTTAAQLKLHWQYKDGSKIFSQPAVANGMTYWGSFDGYEHATNLSGTEVWRTNLGKTTSACHGNTFGVVSSAAVAVEAIGGVATPVVFVGGGDASLYALNANDGSVIWKTSLGASPSHFIWGSPALYNGNLYIGMASLDDCPLVQGQVVQLDGVSGSILHTFNVVPDGCVGGGVWGSTTIDETTGRLYFATGNPGSCASPEPYTEAVVELNVADLSFVSAWQVPQTPGDLDFGSTPTLFTAAINGVSRSLLGVSNKNGTYYVLDRTNLSAGPVWKTKIASKGNPEQGKSAISPSAWDGKQLLVGGGAVSIAGVSCAGSLRSLNPATGAAIWKLCLHSGPVMGPVTLVPGLAFVGAGADIVAVGTSGANAGKILFTYVETGTGSQFWGPPSISNSVLYEGNWDGNLDAIGL